MSNGPDNFLQLQTVFYKNLGLDLFDPHNPWKNRKKILWGVVMACNTPFLIKCILENLEDLDLVIELLCTVLVSSLGVIKFFLVFINQKPIVRLSVRVRDVLRAECSKHEEIAKIIIDENTREQRLTWLYRRSWFGVVFLAGCKPLAAMATIYLNSGVLNFQVPIYSAYPWNLQKIYFFLMTFMWNIGTAIGCVHAFLAMDTLFFSMSYNLCALYKVTNYKLMKFKANTREESEANMAEACHTYKLAMTLCDEFNDCFRSIILTQFFGATLYLCVLCYEASRNLFTLQMLYYLQYVGTLLAQLYLYCYCGEYIKTESENVATTIYDSPWYEVPTKGIRKAVLILLMRSQRGNAIDGYFFTANLETFLSIVRTAMSYVTMLNSFS